MREKKMKELTNNNLVISNEQSLPNLFGTKEGRRIMEGNVSKKDRIKMRISLFAPHKLLKLLKLQMGTLKIKGVINNNSSEPLTQATEMFISELETYAKSIGAISIGYTTVTPNQLLKNETAMYPNAIIVTMEMNKDKISMSPSRETEMMVFDTYHALNILTSKLTAYLQIHGFAGQPGNSIGGLAHYPWLGEMAGLGYRGKHGLLITPDLGPRQRVAVIFTSIGNLPFSHSNDHEWIRDFCNSCNKCARLCPSQAIKVHPNIKGEFQIHMDHDKCFPYFSLNDACGICLNECHFNCRSYDEIKTKFVKSC